MSDSNIKRLIICCDGTWQDLAQATLTNVARFARLVKPEDSEGRQQIVYYSEGLGVADAFDRLVGGAFGWGIDKRIQDAYRFLCLNYSEGDEIYLLGFSRGAYTARSLGGLIYKSGLLSRKHLNNVGKAYQFYRSKYKPSDPVSCKFREDYEAIQVPIKLLGCWDTVGALGVPDTFGLVSKWFNRKYKFHNVTINRKIENAFHAIAIDERRKAFDVAPMLISEGADTRLSQVWFVGDHGCIGGGNPTNQKLSDITLQWMIDAAKQLELEFYEGEEFNHILEGFKPDPSIAFIVKRSLVYQIMGLHDRTLYDPKATTLTLAEIFQQDVHETVKQRWKLGLNPLYRPKPLADFVDFFK